MCPPDPGTLSTTSPPKVRAVSARAMGSLLKGMGSESFSDLVPWLMTTLKSDAGNVERSGAAQVWGRGMDRVLIEMVCRLTDPWLSRCPRDPLESV